MKARILKSAKRIFDCLLLDTGEKIVATALGKLLKDDAIVVGDYVEIQKVKDQFEIQEVHERSNDIYRMIVRENKKKIIAANIDLLVIVTSVSKPEFKRGLVDRYLARAFQWRTPAIVIFNKMDEFTDQLDPRFEAQRLLDIEADCYEISCINDNYETQFLKRGLKELKEDIKGKTTLFVGQSGVGKSKLINSLTNQKFELLTGVLAKKVEKGAHTTTWAELIAFDDFFLIDSPGVRSMSLEDIPLSQIDECFPDVAQAAQNCKFQDCSHEEGIKGCYFEKLDPEELEDLCLLTRLESYMRIKEEISKTPEWQKN